MGKVNKDRLHVFVALVGLLLMGMLSLSWPATAEEFPNIPIPEEDYGVWVPEGAPCSATSRIEVGNNKIRLKFGDVETLFRDPEVYLGCASGTAAQSKEHCIFPEGKNPSFSLIFFPGQDMNKLSYEVIPQKLPPPGFPKANFKLRRCQ